MIIKNLCVSYEGCRVIKDFSAEIGEGITIIMGPSGCGKTTLLRVIAGLEAQDSGEISGAPKRPAFMFQEDRLFPWLSALENIKAVTDDEEKALALLRAVELENEAGSMPSRLSGGMSRRIALARTLAYDSDMIILDEPFNGLDAELTGRLLSLIKSTDVPVVIATHSLEAAKLLGGRIIRLQLR